MDNKIKWYINSRKDGEYCYFSCYEISVRKSDIYRSDLRFWEWRISNMHNVTIITNNENDIINHKERQPKDIIAAKKEVLNALKDIIENDYKSITSYLRQFPYNEILI